MRRSVTLTVVGTAPEKRYENVTPPAWSTANSERLVEVSTPGAPESTGPGAGESCAFGCGAGGGMIVTARGVFACMRPAYAASLPLCAANGTGTATLRSLAGRTFTETSSRRPEAPRNTTFDTDPSFAPRSLISPPFFTRPPDMQLVTHFTPLILGVATYAVPPVPGASEPPEPLAARAEPPLNAQAVAPASTAMRKRSEGE